MIRKAEADASCWCHAKFLVFTGKLRQKHVPFENFVSHLTDLNSAEIFVHTSLPYQNFTQKDL